MLERAVFYHYFYLPVTPKFSLNVTDKNTQQVEATQTATK